MSMRIETGWRRGVTDARGRSVVARARFLDVPLRACVTRDVYLISASLGPAERKAVLRAFCDPVIARSAPGRLPPPAFDWLIQTGFKPGVTDNVGRTARDLLADVLDRPLQQREQVATGVQYFLRGALTREEAWRLARDLLANTLIHTIDVYAPDEWKAAPVDDAVPEVEKSPEGVVCTVDLNGGDEALLRISREGILSLNLEEMRTLRDHFNSRAVRQERLQAGLPEQATDIEIECLAQTWSEHCCHKIFNARIRYLDLEKGTAEQIDSLFDTYIRRATGEIGRRVDWLVSVFSDNAGIIRFHEGLNLVYKVETHNSPSALDPYGGAITGIVGVNRDPMGTGMGAEMLCNTWGYCLASPFYRGDLPAGLFHPRRIRDGVHQGVIDGGNQSGIPYARGFERFDDRYLGKPLVYCGTLGLLPVEVGGGPAERKEICVGDRIVMAGGRIGKDGIHGATFSSEELRKESPAQAVQIGDPITQRKLYDFLLEARDLGLYRALTDNGAGGLSSSVGEMARISGGAEVDLDRAPLKYEGLAPWEIFLSEAQERMTLAVPPEHLEAFFELAARRDVEAADLGCFTGTGRLVLRYRGRVVGLLDMDFLHGGCPVLELEARWSPPRPAAPRPARNRRFDRPLRTVLGALNVCSNEFKARSYDHEVKGRSIVKPFIGVRGDIPSAASVLLAEYGRREGIVLAEGINPFYSDVDAYHMAASVIDEAVRRIVATGGRIGTIAGLDNFCWPDPVESSSNPDGAYKLAQLVRANQALFDLTTAYDVPCISGKDSMKNDSIRGGRRISIPPTLLFSALGKLDDIGRAVTLAFKRPGDAVYAAGVTRDELGGSEYHRLLAAAQGDPALCGGRVPEVDPSAALALYRAMNTAVERGLLRSAHTPTIGGWGVACAFCALAGDLGLDACLDAAPSEGGLSQASLLFSESNSRFLLSAPPEKTRELEALFAGLPLARVGVVTASSRLLLRRGSGRLLVDSPLRELRRAFTGTLKGI